MVMVILIKKNLDDINQSSIKIRKDGIYYWIKLYGLTKVGELRSEKSKNYYVRITLVR